MSFPLVITGVLMFMTIPGMSDGFYLAWAFRYIYRMGYII